jgi:hypothetical protein
MKTTGHCANYGDEKMTRGKKTARKNKKGQFKIQQMAFMLIAVVVFFALVGIFVLAYKLSSIKATANVLEGQNAMLLVSKLADSPEFSCGMAFGETRANCIDFDKVMALRNDMSKYRNFWGVSGIEIRKIYNAEDENEISCSLANYPNCNAIKLLDSSAGGYDYSNFVSLCWKQGNEGSAYNKCEIARLTIRYKEKI